MPSFVRFNTPTRIGLWLTFSDVCLQTGAPFWSRYIDWDAIWQGHSSTIVSDSGKQDLGVGPPVKICIAISIVAKPLQITEHPIETQQRPVQRH